MRFYGERYEKKATRGIVAIVKGTHKKKKWPKRPLQYWSFLDAEGFYKGFESEKPRKADRAYLAANDRYYLLTRLLNRRDVVDEWLYDRCREVEAEPDGYLDLWARFHYKSTIITFAGSIQEVIRDPNTAIAIFSNTARLAAKFLDQIKIELETNGVLKETFPEVFYANPQLQSPAWNKDGIRVRRTVNRKEPTISAYGLMDALPTGAHFPLMIFNDIVTEHSVTQTDTDQIGKTTIRWELAQNLGVHDVQRKWHEGTRYHYADTYGVIIDRKSLKVRLYPATHNGKLTGEPVFLTPERWKEIMRDQRSTLAAQQLQNPLAGEENTFRVEHLRPYEIRPRLLNIYILIDPSKGRNKKSDRTAIAVIGVDVHQNRYFLDGYCHRMKLSRRWDVIKELAAKWKGAAGVQMVRWGYEVYGLQTDLEYMEEKIIAEKLEGIDFDEVNWVKEGPQAKVYRIERLEPYFRNSQFWMPAKVWAVPSGWDREEYQACTWKPNLETQMIDYFPVKGWSKAERQAIQNGEKFRIIEPIRRRDEDGNIYDLTRVFFEEYRLQPFAPHDDLLDATSRIQDMEPTPPIAISSADLNRTNIEDRVDA